MQRFLVVKPCCLGDALMATPVLRALRHAYPTGVIDVVVTPWAAPGFDGHPAVRRLIPYPERPTPVRIVTLARTLARERYDCALGLDRSPYVGALLSLTRIPVRAGIGTGWRSLFYTHAVRPDPSRHETELYLEVLRTLGVHAQGLEPEYHVPATVREQLAARTAHLPRPLVVIHPGGAVNPASRLLAKRWPPERFAMLADRLIDTLGASVILVGSPSDRDAVTAVFTSSGHDLVDWSSSLTWTELAALLSLADLFVGNDTGAGHLAAAVGTPTVSIFGPTSPVRYRPLGRRSVVCAPPESWRLPDDRDLRKPFAVPQELDIRRVTVDDVFAACLGLLRTNGTRP